MSDALTNLSAIQVVTEVEVYSPKIASQIELDFHVAMIGNARGYSQLSAICEGVDQAGRKGRVGKVDVGSP